jgi:hypothetical protein
MQELNDRKPKSREESDATSKETLQDLENDEKPDAGEQGREQESAVASPDGAFDEKKEIDDAGPM